MALKNWVSRWNYKAPPPTLVVYYQNEAVAELKKENGMFFFRYLPSFFSLNLSPLPGLLAINGDEFKAYNDLPAFFRERLPDMKRPEISLWVSRNHIDETDELKMLAALGAHSITDSFELKLSA